MDTSNAPRKRASDAERETVAQRLQGAFADGQLTVAEFDERTRAAYAARFADELPALVADLCPLERPDRPTPATTSANSRAVVTGESNGSAFSLALMGGTKRTGQWLVAPTLTSVALMGGNSLDLREARFAAQETVINALALMGGIEIIVPDDVRIVDDGVGIMGGFGIEDHPSCGLSSADVPAEAPVVRVRGLALMGGVGIIRAARGTRVE